MSSLLKACIFLVLAIGITAQPVREFVSLMSQTVFNPVPANYTEREPAKLTANISNLGYSHDQKLLVVLEEDLQGKFYTYNGFNYAENKTIQIQDGIDATPHSFAFSPNNDLLVIGTKQGGVYGFKMQNGSLITPYAYSLGNQTRESQQEIRSIAISKDGTIVYGAKSSLIVLEVPSDGSQSQNFVQINNITTSMTMLIVAWSPTDSQVFLGGGLSENLGSLALYNTTSESNISQNLGIKAQSAAFSKDGSWLACGSRDSSITIIDVKNSTYIQELNKTIDQTTNATEIIVSNNGLMMGAQISGNNSKVVAWNIKESTNSTHLRQNQQSQSSKKLKDIDVEFTVAMEKLGATNIAFSSSGNSILAVSKESAQVPRYLLCEENQFLDEDAAECNNCAESCLGCYKTADTCVSCRPQFYLEGSQCLVCKNKFNGCVQCKVDGSECFTCNDTENWQKDAVEGQCQCMTGYYQNDQDVCALCSQAIMDCIECSSQTECTSCNDTDNFNPIPVDGKCVCVEGFTIDPDTSKCTACSNFIPGCISCNDTTTCTGCNSTERFIPEPSDDNICLCQAIYYLNQDKCDLCSEKIIDCAECDQTGEKCSQCTSDHRVPEPETNASCVCENFYYENITTQQCILCNIDEQQDKCKICEPPDENTTEPTVCKQCNEDKFWEDKPVEGKCVCKEGYFEKNVSICIICDVPGCAKCDKENTCSSCSEKKGFQPTPVNETTCKCTTDRYPSEDKRQCLACYDAIVGCINCDDSEVCKGCDASKHFVEIPNNESKCICKDTFYLNATQSSCLTCASSIQHCLTCGFNGDDDLVCLKCLDTFVLNTQKTTCKCPPDWELNDGICQEDGGLSALAIVAIIVGILAIAGAAVAIIKCCKKKRSPLDDDDYQDLETTPKN